MRYLLLCAFFISPFAQAKGLIFAIGPSGVSGYESEKEAPNGKKYLDAKGTLGYNFGAELPVLRNFLTINIMAMYSRMEAKTQYFDRTTSIQADDQKSLISNSEALFGLRVRPLNMKYLKVFVGGGGVLGSAKLRHDSDDYVERHGTLPSNFKDVEKVEKYGHFFEAGTEFIFTKNSGLRLMGQVVNSQTKAFETLNHKAVRGTYSIWTIQYMHYFEFRK